MPPAQVSLSVLDLPTSTSFYQSCLQPLGWKFAGTDYHGELIGFGQKPGGPVDVWITARKPGIRTSPVHIVFPAPSRTAVDAFFGAALKAGAMIRKEPLTRDQRNMYHCASVIDHDGNTIEAVYRNDLPISPKEAALPVIVIQDKKSDDAKSATSTGSGGKASKSVTSQKSGPREGEDEKASKNLEGKKTAPTVLVDEKTANTISGTLIGAAASAAIAYAMFKTRREHVYR